MPTKGHLARLVARPGGRDELVAALQPMFAQVEKEPGTLLYLMHISTEEPDVVWMYERFADEAAFEAHAVSPIHSEVTKWLHELCLPGTEAYRVDLIAEKGLPAAPR
ncbi:antibiotic biosynthesis monooxygenase family protein [Streptomyces sp. NPDC051572]|uniref:putative quinol monooxygenase n=1 Tax=unclassified Streptomyces TaxID=2593676 RepID=UPI00344FD9EA